MAIIVGCGCGKRIKFPDHAAGKRAKCPACGAVLTAPIPVPGAGAGTGAEPMAIPPEDDTYELLGPSEPLAPVAAPLRRKPDDTDGEAPLPGAGLRTDSPLYRASALRVAQRDAVAAAGPKPLFNAFGIDVTRTKLGVFVAVLLLLIALPTWFFTLGPGVDARVLSTQTVQVVTLLEGLDSQDPFSIFTGSGNRSLGVQGPKLKNAPTGAAATVDVQYTVGGGDALLLTRPDPKGAYILVEAEVSHALIQYSQRLIQHKAVVNANDFALAVEGGATPIVPKLLFARFEKGVEIDLNGPNAIGHECLLPVGVKPSKETLERGKGGGAAGGVIRYDGVNGVNGELEFSSAYFASGFPGARGLSATGHVTRFTPDGTEVKYDYRGGELEMQWTEAPHRAAWWSRGTFREDESFNPYSRVKVALLFDRPPGAGAGGPGDAPMQLTYCGEPVGKVNVAKAAATGEKLGAETDEASAKKPSAFASGPQDPLTGYLKVLSDARKKAKGVASMSNLQQIGMAIGLYADANKGRLPESLYDLKSVMPDIDSVLINVRTGERPGFLYEPPADSFGQVKDPMRTPIVWEAEGGQKMQGGSVLYADGHIESPLIP